MLVAMPGLPMFGHGQIEGFEEKYGMEYRRAYYNEQVNTGLVERHQREIFPLMRQRRLFSGVENFLLYDFRTDGQVNENVFAWSNVYGDSRSLILYNNKYEQTAGWINMSVAYAVKGSGDEKQLVQRTLAQGLLLTITSSRFVIFQEQHSKLWFIRKNSEIAERGLFGISEKEFGTRQIDKSFVDGNLVDVGRIFTEYIHDPSGDFVIALMSSVQVDARRAEPVRFGDGHSRVDAVYARFVGCR